MSNQILAGAVINAGMVIAGIDADNPPFVGSASTSSTVANKIFMWSSDAAAHQGGTGRSDVGGVVMTDGDFSNPTTIQLDSPQMVVGGEGKVVTISQHGEIKVYDESTGQLEQTFNDSYLDSVKTTDLWGSANDAVIGAGKIFISAPEYNPQGIGSIIVVDLLDRNVDTYLITPTLGNYSRLSSVSYGGIHFIDGRIYGHTEQWSSADHGIWHFAPDGSDEQFIPTPGADGGSGLVKWGDNFVIHSGYHDIQLIDSSGAVLQTLSKPVDFSFGQDFGLTSTGKLAVLKHETNSPMTHSIFLYDEGFTNEIEITQPADSTDIYWGYGTKANSGGFEVFGEYILVSATEADNNGITNCGAVYRYNDSGVLQNIFYGTVADQKIGTNISVGTATATTAPVSSAPSISHYIVGANAHDISSSESNSGAVYVFNATDTTAQPVKLVHPEYGDAGSRASDKFGFSVSSSSGKLVVGAPFHDDPYQSGSAYVYDLTDLTAAPTRLTPAGFQDKFGVTTVMTGSNIVVGAPRDDDGAGGPGSYVADSGAVYVYNTNDLSATPTQLKAPDAEAYDYFGDHVSANSDKIAVTAIYGDETSNDTGAVYLYDANDLSAAPTKLTALAADGTNHANLHFGKALAMSSDKLVVGTMDDTDVSNGGSVYVYDLNDLSASPSKLMPTDASSNKKFGSAIAVTSDKIIVGADNDNGGSGSYSGSIYVYDANDLSAQPTKISAFDGAEDDHFGYGLAAVSNTLFVGSYNDDGEGSTYIYDLGDLSAQPTKLTAFDGASGDKFGYSVAIG